MGWDRDRTYLRMFGKPIAQRKDELSMERFGYRYSEGCWKRQHTIDSLIDREIRQGAGVGG